MPLWSVFGAQIVGAGAAYVAGVALARRSRAVWSLALGVSFALVLCWPLMRVFPVGVIELLGAPAVACIELTALAIPAAMLFAIGAERVPRASDRRAIRWLVIVLAVYFMKAGWWMTPAGVGAVGPTKIDMEGICRQTTEYTCVAASMVTMLRAHGVEAEEREMAELSRTQVGGGATDSRALWALDLKLAGTAWRARYVSVRPGELASVPKPCMVQLNWGFFTSHMVPLLRADEKDVVIGDPLGGLRRMSLESFRRQWKGQAIVLEAR